MLDSRANYPVTWVRNTPGIHEQLSNAGAAVKVYHGWHNERLHLHTPEIVLLTFIAAGRTRHVLENVEFEDGPGTLSVTHYGQVHSLWTYPDQPVDVINIFLDPQNFPLPKMPPALAHVLPEIVPLHPCLGHELNRVVRLQLPDAQGARARLEAIEAEQTRQEPGYDTAIQLLVRLFLIDCCRAALHSGLQPLSRRIPAAAQRLEDLRLFLDAHFADEHSLDSLAGRAGMSVEHLCRSFKAYTGSTVVGYLLRRRLQEAMIRLRNSEAKIAAIAYDCGFGDLSHFNRQFKANVGLTPSQYRKPNGRAS